MPDLHTADVDDEFHSLNVKWTRRWVGDNGGRYMWLSDCGQLQACRHNGSYIAAIGGKAVMGSDGKHRTWSTLKAAMDAAALEKGGASRPAIVRECQMTADQADEIKRLVQMGGK